MLRRLTPIILAAFVLVTFCVTALAANKPPAKPEEPPKRILKKRIAVMPTDTQIETWSWLYGPNEFAGGLTEMLTTELVNTKRFIVVERAALEDITKEQELAAGGKTTEETGAKTGKLIGAEWLVRGTLTSFQESHSGGAGGVSIGGLSIGGSKQSAQLALDCRIFDSTSGQVIDSRHVEAKAKGGGAGVSFGTGNFNINAAGFAKTPLGTAMREAVQKWVKFITESIGDKPWEGRIITVTDQGIYINGGSDLGVMPGDEFKVLREGEQLIDPATGLPLGSERTEVGSIVVTKVLEKYAVAQALTGEGFKRNDVLVESKLAPAEPTEPAAGGA